MSEVIEMKTAELTGLPLHWAVALADRGTERMPSPWQFKVWSDYNPSVSWMQGGPLRDKYRVSLEQSAFGGGVRAQCWADASGNQVIGYPSAVGDTALIAISRAIVAATFGDTVPVPIALTGGAA